MRQHPDPDDVHDQDLDDDLGRPVYQGSGLTVRELDAEQLQRFLDAHAGQPTRLPGSGWAALDPPGHALGGPRPPPGAGLEAPEPLATVPAEPITGSQGSPGRSAVVEYRRRRALELADWTRTLTWRAPLVAVAGLLSYTLGSQIDLPPAGLVGLRWLRWSAGGYDSGLPSRPAPGSAAPKGSGTPPASWTGSRATATWSSMTWPCPTRPPTSTAMICVAVVTARSDPNVDRPRCLESGSVDRCCGRRGAPTGRANVTS